MPSIPLPQRLKKFRGTSAPIKEPYLQRRNNAVIPLKEPNINDSILCFLLIYVTSITRIIIPHIIQKIFSLSKTFHLLLNKYISECKNKLDVSTLFCKNYNKCDYSKLFAVETSSKYFPDIFGN